MGYQASVLGLMRSTLRSFAARAVVVLLLFTVAGCNLRPASTSNKSPRATPVKTKLTISGAGSVIAMLKLLEPDFERAEPGVRLEFLPGARSAGAIRGVAARTLDVGTVTRRPEADELRYHLRYWGVARDPLAVAVHRGVGVSSLSVQQLRSIYAGRLKNWRQLGGPNLPIVVLVRNEDDAAMVAFRKHVLGAKLKVFPEATRLFYESDLVEALLGTRGAIGFLSYGYIRSQDVPVEVLGVDGVKPSVSAVSNGSYKMIRHVGVVTMPRPSESVLALANYLTGPRAGSILAEHGYASYKQR